MYPPKVHQFAYVTDEVCTEDEILSMEVIIMKVGATRGRLLNLCSLSLLAKQCFCVTCFFCSLCVCTVRLGIINSTWHCLAYCMFSDVGNML